MASSREQAELRHPSALSTANSVTVREIGPLLYKDLPRREFPQRESGLRGNPCSEVNETKKLVAHSLCPLTDHSRVGVAPKCGRSAHCQTRVLVRYSEPRGRLFITCYCSVLGPGLGFANASCADPRRSARSLRRDPRSPCARTRGCWRPVSRRGRAPAALP